MELSINAKLYYGTAGATAATELTTVGDVSVKLKKGAAKANSRASKWAKVKGVMREASITFSILADDTDANLAALIAAWVADTPLAFLILDKAGGNGLDGDFDLIGMDREEKLEEGVVYSFEIQPTPSTRDLAWV
jgi:hypothetical protein